MKTVMIGIARMGSTRLPGKVLKPLGGYHVLDWVVAAGESAPGVDEVWIATTTESRDDLIEAWCIENSVNCYRGSETDVLARVYGAAKEAKADVVVRVTCDCPFLDPIVIGEVVALRAATGAAYASNNDPPSWPDGLDCEAIDFRALEITHMLATRPTDRDTVTQYIVRNRTRFPAVSLNCPIPGLHKERWVLDTEADYKMCQELAKHVSFAPSYLNVLAVMNSHPELREINKDHPRNERFFAALAAEEPIHRDHGQSKGMLEEALEVIPLGTQTFSKSHLQYPVEAPMIVTHGNGGLVYDVDGNEYVDLVGGLLPNILGYRDPDVDAAIRHQLNAGISFSLATELEAKLARLLRSIIPCAEMSRFGKTGTDVTTAAVRLARHITGRDLVLTSGYHGWADWCIAGDDVRNNGVPRAVKDLTVTFRPNDFEVIKQIYSRNFACVIIEPDSFERIHLASLREACTLTGTILIFDEIITGFRTNIGGIQGETGDIPDLATFGKAMANGMPISAIVGKAKYMKHMDEICFSGTFFGEALSLAAALATITKLKKEKVIDRLDERNREIASFVEDLNEEMGLNFVEIYEHGLSRIGFKPIADLTKEETKTLFIQEMIANGVLIIASHNFCFAHTDNDLERIKNAYRRTFEVFKGQSLKGLIKGKAIEATANVRLQA
tara:strand:- start:4356 stop:6365 length:2010 start_codon:yes stop_codon:yes gene_type:complete